MQPFIKMTNKHLILMQKTAFKIIISEIKHLKTNFFKKILKKIQIFLYLLLNIIKILQKKHIFDNLDNLQDFKIFIIFKESAKLPQNESRHKYNRNNNKTDGKPNLN